VTAASRVGSLIAGGGDASPDIARLCNLRSDAARSPGRASRPSRTVSGAGSFN
jgi:hypothetical protein